MKTIKQYRCPICGNYTLDVKNEYYICPVCFWEDDGSEEYPDEDCGPNHISFNDAKKSWNENAYIHKSDKKYIRKPFGCELPKDGKAYLDIKKYLDNPIDSYKEAIKALKYETSHSVINDCDFLEAKHKAFKILNALAYCDDVVGKKAANHLALCYANGYGCKKRLDIACNLLNEIDNRYGTRLKDISIQRSNDKDTIEIKLCEKANANYLKVICDELSNKLDANKYGIIKCEILNNNGILIETKCCINSNGDLVKDLEKLFIDFINIETVIVDPNAFKNPHEGIAYFNGAKSILKKYLFYN